MKRLIGSNVITTGRNRTLWLSSFVLFCLGDVLDQDVFAAAFSHSSILSHATPADISSVTSMMMVNTIQIEEDIAFDSWCDENGIVRIGVQTITTPKSLGGRGLFATQSMKAGTVVASIPSKLVISSKSPEARIGSYPSADNVEEWQVSLTQQVIDIVRRQKNSDNLESNAWIESWKGSGQLELESLLISISPFFPLDNLDEEMERIPEVQSFVDAITGQGIITRKGAIQDVKDRVSNYEKRRRHFIVNGKEGEDDDDVLGDIEKWYTLVMSRAAYLGKDWNYQCGIVPFFDMLNHCHDRKQVNTELMGFGKCLDAMKKQSSNNGSENISLDRRDMLLVLTRDVEKGEELLTQYATDLDDEETQLKLRVQYGIPPP